MLGTLALDWSAFMPSSLDSNPYFNALIASPSAS
jgi:hypothetical protein